MAARKKGPAPSQVFGERVQVVRRHKGWTSQQALTDRLAELGYDVDRSAINRLERGHRKTPLDEALAIAAALEVSPLSLMLPEDPEALIAVAPRLSVRSEDARAWLRGVEPLPGQDRRFFEQEDLAHWVEVLAWRHTQALYALVHRLAEAWDQEDTDNVASVLDALSEAIKAQRAEVARVRRARTKGGTDGKR